MHALFSMSRVNKILESFKFMIMSESIKIQLMFHRIQLDIFIECQLIYWLYGFGIFSREQARQHQQMFDCNFFRVCAVNLDLQHRCLMFEIHARLMWI